MRTSRRPSGAGFTVGDAIPAMNESAADVEYVFDANSSTTPDIRHYLKSLWVRWHFVEALVPGGPPRFGCQHDSGEPVERRQTPVPGGHLLPAPPTNSSNEISKDPTGIFRG